MTVLDVASRSVIKTLNFKIKDVHPDKVQPVDVKLVPTANIPCRPGPANHVTVIQYEPWRCSTTCWSAAASGRWRHPDQRQLLATNASATCVGDRRRQPEGGQVGQGGRYRGAWWSRRERLTVNDLSFAYLQRQACARSVRLAPGQRTALLGPNGAGKSTLIALLTRLYTVRNHRSGLRLLG